MPATSGRLARHRSPFRIRGTPILSVMLASLIPSMLPMVSVSPAVPPLGLLMLLAWRLLRPEMWPLWIGLPLGFFDDLATGHPVGTAMALWTLALIAIESASLRLLWRDYVQDWLIAAAALICVITMSWLFMHIIAGSAGGPLSALFPQIAASILIFPVVARLCASLDRWRLP
jgi:rod shape-determining protein MreD